MPKETLKIIGINPGTRYLGISVFQDSDLRDWRIKVFQEKWSVDKIKKIKKTILDLMDDYEPNILAIKKLHPSRSSKNLKLLTAWIKESCKKKGLRILQFSIKELEDFYLPNEKLNKRNLIKKISSEYPELIHQYDRETRNKNPYFIRMFESVALASFSFHQLDK